MSEEIWKDVEGTDKIYQVSNLGNVKTVDRMVKQKHNSEQFKRGRMLKFDTSSKGYMRVNIHYSEGFKKRSLVHRLVIREFMYDSDLQVNHINGNKSDNRLENLEYVTHLENHNHKVRVINNKKRYGIYKSRCKKGKWVAQIRLNSKTITLGTFDDEELAYQVFYDAYVKAHGKAPW